MTSDQFNTWTADLCRKFPAISKWLETVDASGLLSEWAEVMERTPFVEAMTANKRMLAGDEGDLPGSFPSDWQALPGQVRRIAARLAPTPAKALPDDYKPSTFPAGRILKRWLELEASGIDREEAKQQALREFPIGPPDREPRYNCPVCQDERRIFVASKWAIIAMLNGKFDTCHHREGVMRCKCDRRPHSERFPLETFDSKLDFRLDDPSWGPKTVADFREWVEFQREHSTEQRAKACSNYEDSFASFNSR